MSPTPQVNYIRDHFGVSRRKNGDVLDNASAEDKIVIQRLATRRYHLPGLSYKQDYFQFLSNTHVLLGLCCSHRLHPFTTSDRVFLLLGSVAFGLAATSGVVIWFHLMGRNNLDVGVIPITPAIVGSWAGGICSVLDLFLWYLHSCFCCLPGAIYNLNEICSGKRWVSVGRHLAAFIVAMTTILAVGVVVLRSWIEQEVELDEVDNSGWDQFSFLNSFLTTLGLSFFIFDPIIAFVFFSGVLGCFRIPVLGGRPWEMQKEMQKEDNGAESKV